MPIDIQRFSEYRPVDSITYLGDVKTARDYQSPFSFSSWLASFKQFNESPQIYIDLYRKYLSAWYTVKNSILLTNEQVVVLSYISVFYDLKLTYFTSDERRFLTTLDYTNKQDIDIAIPFFARKIKDICKELIDLRETVKSQPVKLNLGGTKETLAKVLYDSIYALYKDTDLQPLFYKDGVSEEQILNFTRVYIEELYDDTDYYTLSGSNEVIDIYPDLFLNFTNAIIAQLSSVEYIVPELSPFLTFVPELDPTDLTYLYDKDFITTINNGLSSNLNINNLAALTRVFAGTNFYYLSSNSLSEVVSGSLFVTTSDSANDQNIFDLKFAVKQLVGDNLYTAKDVGGFYLPDRIGMLYYNPIKSTFIFNNENIAPNTVTVFPNPAIYPYDHYGVLSFQYNTTVFKHTISDQYINGDIKDDRNLPDFKGYQSYNQTINDYFNNVSKPTDSTGFFKDAKENIWLNPDVYPNAADAIFPVGPRQDKLLIDNNKDLIKFRSDVYGNSYGFFKEVYKVENITKAAVQTITCLELDGFFFNWTRFSGIDFDYNVTTPPISGYTRSGITAATFDQLTTIGLTTEPSFVLSGDYYYLFGGSFTDIYCNSEEFTIYNGSVVYDGYTFIDPYNNALLYEFPSTDSPLWPGNAANIYNLYYQYLLEGGVNQNAQRPTFTIPATFKPTALSATGYTFIDSNQIVDCGAFIYYKVENGIPVEYDPFALKANDYYQQNIPCYTYLLSTNTTEYAYTSGLSSNFDIYKKRNLVYGDLIVRSGNNTIIEPISAALSANFARYPFAVKEEINNGIIDFDIIYDTLIIETDTYKVIEKINYIYETNSFTSTYTPAIYFQRSITETSLEKFGDFWFNEHYKNILFFNTTLSDSVSGNMKIIYPTVYKLDLTDYQFKKIYPNVNTNLDQFSLTNYLSSYYNNYTTPFENIQYIFNPQNVDKPSVSFNNVDEVYTVVAKVYDNAGGYCISEQQFKFISGVFTLISNKWYFGNELIRDESYSNSLTANFLDYITPAAGLNIGTWDPAIGTYKF